LADSVKFALSPSPYSQGPRKPKDQNNDDEYSSGSSLGISDDDDGWQNDEDEPPTDNQLVPSERLRMIDETISHLYRITSITKKHYLNYEDERVSHWVPHDVDGLEHQLQDLESYTLSLIEGDYPQIQSFLKDRLVQTIKQRRRRLLYQQTHPIRVEDLKDSTEKLSTSNEQQETTSSDDPLKSEEEMCSTPPFQDNVNDEGVSELEHHDPQDIRPYICLFESCDTPLRQFATKDEWFIHMASQHTRVWVCQAKSHENYIFQTSADLETHLQEDHVALLQDHQMSFLVAISARAGPDIFGTLAAKNTTKDGNISSICPFCNLESPVTNLKSGSKLGTSGHGYRHEIHEVQGRGSPDIESEPGPSNPLVRKRTDTSPERQFKKLKQPEASIDDLRDSNKNIQEHVAVHLEGLARVSLPTRR
jgi:hypothetical protein